MDRGVKRAVLVWHRRAGKDKTVINALIKKMLQRVGVYYYFLPTYSQGKKIIWDGIDGTGVRMLEHFPKELVRKKNETDLQIELVNGSIFQVIGTEKIDSIVGSNPVGCVFSEYSIQDPKAWNFIRPILAENGGFAIFVYTPRGMNHGWVLMEQMKQDPNAFVQLLTVEDTKAISAEALAKERLEMPKDLFEQEYYCKFLDGAGQFFRNFQVIDPITEVLPDNKFSLGVDLAKYQDFTVLTPFNLNTFNVHKQFRFNNVDYTAQKARIEAEYYKHNKPLVRLDSTGVGEPVHDDLANKGINIDGFHFTEQSRKDLLTNLQLLLEQNIIRIPNDPILLGELRSFQYTLSDSGRTKIQVPHGVHDDTVFSLALAVWDIPRTPLRVMSNSLFHLTAHKPQAISSSYE